MSSSIGDITMTGNEMICKLISLDVDPPNRCVKKRGGEFEGCYVATWFYDHRIELGTRAAVIGARLQFLGFEVVHTADSDAFWYGGSPPIESVVYFKEANES